MVSKKFVRAALSSGLLMLAVTPGAASAASKFTRLSDVNGTIAPATALARSADGTLHLVYQTYSGRTLNGMASMTISAAGKPGPQVQALAGWQPGQPGLVSFANGALQAYFGAISPGLVSSVWAITSTNGGSSWSAPADVKSGPNESLAYGSDVTAALTGSTPVLTLPQAGNVVIQQGLGPGSPTFPLTTTADGATTDATLAVDAATGAVVAGWYSIANSLTDYLQGAVPAGALQAVPGKPQNLVTPVGRDSGPGVFAPYSTDGFHVRLLRYGGGSVAVGSVKGLNAKVLGAATSLAGRIWVMWGTDNGAGVAVTRSNKAVTRFEPIQVVNPNVASIYRVFGDGRLGPLDLLVDEIENIKGTIPPPGNFYARVLPVLSASFSVASVKGKNGKVTAHKLTIKVSDAGDAIAGATVSVKGKKAKTNSAGVAKVTLPGSSAGFVKVTITDPGYNVLTKTVKL